MEGAVFCIYPILSEDRERNTVSDEGVVFCIYPILSEDRERNTVSDGGGRILYLSHSVC